MRQGHKLCLQSAYVVIFATNVRANCDFCNKVFVFLLQTSVFPKLRTAWRADLWVLTNSSCPLEVKLNPAEDSLADLFVLRILDCPHTALLRTAWLTSLSAYILLVLKKNLLVLIDSI